MEHTKRKWEVGSYRRREIWAGADFHIATCHKGSFTEEETQANARLIAAAPETARQRDELRENLENLVRLLCHPGSFVKEKDIENAKAAITKTKE